MECCPAFDGSSRKSVKAVQNCNFHDKIEAEEDGERKRREICMTHSVGLKLMLYFVCFVVNGISRNRESLNYSNSEHTPFIKNP